MVIKLEMSSCSGRTAARPE